MSIRFKCAKCGVFHIYGIPCRASDLLKKQTKDQCDFIDSLVLRVKNIESGLELLEQKIKNRKNQTEDSNENKSC